MKEFYSILTQNSFTVWNFLIQNCNNCIKKFHFVKISHWIALQTQGMSVLKYGIKNGASCLAAIAGLLSWYM